MAEHKEPEDQGSLAAQIPGTGVQPAAAWATEDGDRVIPDCTMQQAERDGGALLSSMAPYTVKLVHAGAGQESLPEAWAWATEGGERVVGNRTMQQAQRDGGALKSSMRVFTVKLVRADASGGSTSGAALQGAGLALKASASAAAASSALTCIAAAKGGLHAFCRGEGQLRVVHRHSLRLQAG